MPIELTPITPADLPVTYSTRSDVEDLFGIDNVSVWADLNSNQDQGEIENRIGRARQYAYDLINSRLGSAGITVPVTADILGITDFGLMDDIEAELAGVWLYRARGRGDTTSDREGQMQGHWDNAIAELDRIVSANVDDTTEPGGFGSVPLTFEPTCNRDEFSGW